MGCGPEDTPAYMIGNALHDEFFKNKRRQKDVATILGISPVYLSRLVNGRQRVSLKVAVRMHSRLGWPSLDYVQAQAAMDFEREAERPAGRPP